MPHLLEILPVPLVTLLTSFIEEVGEDHALQLIKKGGTMPLSIANSRAAYLRAIKYLELEFMIQV